MAAPKVDVYLMLGEENIPMPPPMVNGTTEVINDNNVSAGGHCGAGFMCLTCY